MTAQVVALLFLAGSFGVFYWLYRLYLISVQEDIITRCIPYGRPAYLWATRVRIAELAKLDHLKDIRVRLFRSMQVHLYHKGHLVVLHFKGDLLYHGDSRANKDYLDAYWEASE